MKPKDNEQVDQKAEGMNLEEAKKILAQAAQDRADAAVAEFDAFLADLCKRHGVRMEIGLVIWGDFVEHPIRFVPV